MNQQQLQIARAALWHQTAATDSASPLLTFDDAARWLDDTGLCLFLPRHTQLPAPAPSFVEACLGATAVTPPPTAIAQATEIVNRLIDEHRVIPLNLLGAVSEQPDFLVTPEVLPWAAAVRGDRQWKAAPGGRTAPIVLRTWEALDRTGEMTSVAIREALGRELTEAAVLRALIELWTNLRAMPIYAAGGPTRWTLLKNRYPAQLATAANTAQTTALSALLCIYLRSAVAASAEEAEIFLSPLTARSRIREVIHGMTAARQIGTMSVGSQTLLFVEGSLPETVPAPEPEKPIATPAAFAPAPRIPFRKAPRPTRWEMPARSARPEQDGPRAPWQKKPAGPHRPRPSAEQPGGEGKTNLGPRPDSRPSRPDSKPSFAPRSNRPGAKPRFGPRPDSRPARPGSRPSFGSRPNRTGAKPWQRRPNTAFRKPSSTFRKPDTEVPGRRPTQEDRPQREQHWRGKDSASPQPRASRPWQKDRPRRDQPAQREGRPTREAGPREDHPFRPKSSRPAGSFGPKSGGKFAPKAGGKFIAKPGAKFRAKPGGKFIGTPGAKSGPETRFSGPRTSAAGKSRSGAGSSRSFRPGKFSPGKPNRPAGSGPRPASPGKPKNKFRNLPPRERNPRKNRNQEEKPE